MLLFLDPDFENHSPEETAIEWASRWEEEQHDALKEAKKSKDFQAMMLAVSAMRASVHEWNPEIFIVFGKRKLRSIQRQLRAYIDEWIDSGFHSDGSEFPSKRNFKPEFRNNGDGTDTSRPKWNSPPEAYAPAPAAISAIARLHRGKAVPFGAHYEIEIEKDAESPVAMSISSRGGVDYFLRREWLGSTDGLRAAQIFYWFFRSGFVFLLMRCNRCKALSMPKTKPRRKYERGWHCDKCRNSAAAQAATDAKRAQQRERWFALAVDAYREYRSKPRRSTHDVSAFLAERVNKSLPYSSRIKRNTITRNLTKIQAEEAEWRKHYATRKS
jgi:transposase-like protein